MQPTGERWRLGHRPALDGLRGIAVLLVLGDHAGFVPEPSGAVGVTVFFVLSGFLITRVIVEARDTGSWSFARFFGNRATRLFPALVVVVVVTTAWWAGSGRPLGEMAVSAAAALGYVGNVFHPQLTGTVLDHTWSLANEEQFYLVWPLVVPALIDRRTWLAWLVVAIGVSIALRLLLAVDHVDTAYASLPTNAGALLSGCALALCGPRLMRPPPFTGSVGVLALGCLVVVAPALPSPYITAPLIALPISAGLVWGGLRSDRLLHAYPLRLMGRISYSAYLWHWPLLWLTGTTFAGARALPALAASLLIATASTVLLEEPIRRWWRSRSERRAEVLGEDIQHGVVGADRGRTAHERA